jgi:phage terminase large subunit-like protein
VTQPFELPSDWRSIDEHSKRLLLERLSELRDTATRTKWQPYPWQHPHAHEHGELVICDESCLYRPVLVPSAHDMWLLFGGRGTGKTDGAARYVADHVRGPACDPRLPGGHRIAIIAPTLGDAAESCVNGPSGLSTHYPGVKLWSQAGGTFVRFPNGAIAKLFGASSPEDVERLRAGGNRCLAWWEELAAWRRLAQCMEHSRYGLRIGSNPHIVASTTPKTKPAIIALVDGKPASGGATAMRVHVTRGRTKDAHHLDAATRQAFMDQYGGTRSGRQELDGELMRDVEGALWTYDLIDQGRARKYDPVTLAGALKHVTVAIDPAVTNTEESDETGIVVTGRSSRDHCPVCGPVEEPHGFVLGDYTVRAGPRGWAERALAAFDHFGANEVVAEVNNGGDMVREVLDAATDRENRARVPYRDVRASKGKRMRAEPVAVLYGNVDPSNGPLSRSRVHHVDGLDEVEAQQASWTPDDANSPDRLDALVWGLTHELVKGARGMSAVG